MSDRWTKVRVFVSSTFKDMHAERDWLVRFVFPRLRQHLLPLRVHLTEIDLRWGVASDQDVVDACCEIIDECRPHFVCILGGRYGVTRPDLGHSVTAEEIRYAVLDYDQREDDCCHFYFRDDATTLSMVGEQDWEFRDQPGSDSDRRLAELKQAISAAGFRPVTYKATWDASVGRLVGLSAFGEQVYRDLARAIEKDLSTRASSSYPQDSSQGSDGAASVFVADRRDGFVLGSRATLIAHMEDAVHHGSGYLCITGPAGSGKSALLAHLTEKYESSTSSVACIQHFVGATKQAADPQGVLRSICVDLANCIGDWSGSIPNELGRLRNCFFELLQVLSSRKRTLVVIDAINQVRGRGASEAQWLPEKVPENSLVVVSTTEGPLATQLESTHRATQLPISDLTHADRRRIILTFQQRYRKRLEEFQILSLVKKAGASRPLYLVAALAELRTLGSVEDTARQINEMPADTQGVFRWVLESLCNRAGFWGPDGQQAGTRLVTTFAVMLASSRYGLTHGELVDLVIQETRWVTSRRLLISCGLI